MKGHVRHKVRICRAKSGPDLKAAFAAALYVCCLRQRTSNRRIHGSSEEQQLILSTPNHTFRGSLLLLYDSLLSMIPPPPSQPVPDNGGTYHARPDKLFFGSFSPDILPRPCPRLRARPSLPETDGRGRLSCNHRCARPAAPLSIVSGSRAWWWR